MTRKKTSHGSGCARQARRDVLERTRAIKTMAVAPKRLGRYAELMKNEPTTGPFKYAHEGIIDVQAGPLDGTEPTEVRIMKDDGSVWLTNALFPLNLVGRKVRITIETIGE